MSPASYQTAPPRDVFCCNLPALPVLTALTALCQSGKRDSNPRPQPWQGCALPTELFPQAERSLAPAPHQRNRGTSAQRPPPTRGNGGEGDRTPDLVNAIHALSQLSYAPAILVPPSVVCDRWRRGSTEIYTVPRASVKPITHVSTICRRRNPATGTHPLDRPSARPTLRPKRTATT